jgi:hypothetical protein
MTDLSKPVRRIARGVGPRGFRPDLIVTLYPGGILGLRETRARATAELRIPLTWILTVWTERRAKRYLEYRKTARRDRRRPVSFRCWLAEETKGDAHAR